MKKTWGAVAVVIWALAVGFGMERLWSYSVTPGVAASAPGNWPGSPTIVPRPGRATLVMFIHPHCPCSRASLEEMRTIMERARNPVAAWILFMRPQGMEKNWEHTDSWELARRIPKVTIAVDADGREAKRFGAETSGHVVLYDALGHSVFSGGITAGRGHVGDNGGQQQVLNLVNGKPTDDQDSHPVFGCRFHERQVAGT